MEITQEMRDKYPGMVSIIEAMEASAKKVFVSLIFLMTVMEAQKQEREKWQTACERYSPGFSTVIESFMEESILAHKRSKRIDKNVR